MSVTVVTTCSLPGYNEYGHRFIPTFEEFWPREVPLLFFTDGFEFDDPNIRATPFDLKKTSAWLADFIEKNKDNPAAHGAGKSGKRGYTFNAVKFAHKVAAVLAADLRCTTRYLCWLDADTITHSAVSLDDIFTWLPDPAWLSWLDRNPKIISYPECGFLLFDRQHFQHYEAMCFMRDIYASNEVLKLEQTHDSWVWQHCVNTLGLPVRSMSGKGYDTLHVQANSILSTWMDHLKGPRKQRGRTDKIERPKIRDGHPYWSY